MSSVPNNGLNDLEKLLSSQEFHPRQGEEPPKAPEPQPQVEKVSQQLSELEKKLTNNSAANQQSQLLQQLLSDPNIVKVIEARNNGKKIQVLGDDEVQNQPKREVTTPEDFSKPDDVVKYLDQVIEQRMAKLLDQKLSPVTERLTRHDQVIAQEQQVNMDKLLTDTREKYPEFDDYIPEMREINLKTGQTLTPLQLLAAAKVQKGHINEPSKRRELESERPTDFVSKPSGRTAYEPTGRGLDAALRAAADRGVNKLKF